MRERINPKSSLTQSQGAEVAQWLESIFEELPKTEMPYHWAQLSSTGENWRPYHSLKLATGRELRIYNHEQASGLHHLITGATLGNMPPPKRRAPEYRYPQPDNVDRDADAIMRVYGHPLYCVAAIERQLDWYWQQSEEERKKLLPLGHIYEIQERLRMRADGFIITVRYGRPGYQFTSVTPYDLEGAMLRLCPQQARDPLCVSTT